jgi:hypothetical protein
MILETFPAGPIKIHNSQEGQNKNEIKIFIFEIYKIPFWD